MVEELEHLVMGIVGHEIDTRADVGASYELEPERAAGGSDTISTGVVSAVKRTVGSAGFGVRAERSIPLVTSVTVCVAAGGVEPTPVCIENDLGTEGLASTARGALLRRKRWVDLSHVRTDLLAGHQGEEGERNEICSAEHDYRNETLSVGSSKEMMGTYLECGK